MKFGDILVFSEFRVVCSLLKQQHLLLPRSRRSAMITIASAYSYTVICIRIYLHHKCKKTKPSRKCNLKQLSHKMQLISVRAFCLGRVPHYDALTLNLLLFFLVLFFSPTQVNPCLYYSYNRYSCQQYSYSVYDKSFHDRGWFSN